MYRAFSSPTRGQEAASRDLLAMGAAMAYVGLHTKLPTSDAKQ